MTKDLSKEFSDLFDVLYNNITSNQAPGLDAYEKSVLLTQAQEELVKNRFTLKGNKYQEGIGDSIKRDADFSLLMRTKTIDENTLLTDDNKTWYHGNSHYFVYPSDIFLIVNEQCLVSTSTGTNVTSFIVVPISYDEYTRLMQKPYKYPLKGQVWKIVTGMKVESWETIDNTQDTITGNTIGTDTLTPIEDDTPVEEPEDVKMEYKPIVELAGVRDLFSEQKVQCRVRYVKRPEPIILEDLRPIDSDLKIQGRYAENICKLPEHLHSEIIQRAAELAKAIWQGDLNTSIEMGNRKE